MADQVTYSMTMKISKDFNSGGVVVGFTTDVREGETEALAMERCVEFVENVMDEKYSQLEEIYG